MEISNIDKHKINKIRFSMMAMLLPMNKTQAKYEFIVFATKASRKIQEWNK